MSKKRNGEAYKENEFFGFSKSDFLNIKDPQVRELAGTVLTLAVQYNQIKDLHELIVLEIEKMKKVTAGIRPEVGHLVGRCNMLVRFLYATIHEFLNFIRKQPKLFESKEFKTLVEKLPNKPRGYWDAICSDALDNTDNFLSKVLIKLRNNVIYHIQSPKNYMSGLQSSIQEITGDRAFISEGKQMFGTRFYFADAATQSYVRTVMGIKPDGEVFDEFMKLTRSINNAIYHLVLAFFQTHMSESITLEEFEFDPEGKTLV